MSVLIPLDRLDDNPWQTREAYDQAYIEALAQDIWKNGLLQTPVARATEEINPFYLLSDTSFELFLQENPAVRFQLAFGHNRLRVYRFLAGSAESLVDRTSFSQILIDVRTLSDEQMALQAWSENAQRKDLNPVEEARAIRRRMDDFGWTQDVCAQQLGLHRSTISNKLRLLELPKKVLGAVSEGQISERQAAAMLPYYQLTKEERAAAKRSNAWGLNDGDELLKGAMSGDSSDIIRRCSERWKEEATYQLNRERIAEERRAEEDRQKAEEAARPRAEESAPVVSKPKKKTAAKRVVPVQPDPETVPETIGGFPNLKYDPVWYEVDSYTKARLEETWKRFATGLFNRYSLEDFHRAALRDSMLAIVKRAVRFHACLECAYHLTDAQVDRFLIWARENMSGDRHSVRSSHLTDWQAIRSGEFVFGGLRDVERLELLSPDTLLAYQRAEARRIAAFSYHLFLEHKAKDVPALAGDGVAAGMEIVVS